MLQMGTKKETVEETTAERQYCNNNLYCMLYAYNENDG